MIDKCVGKISRVMAHGTVTACILMNGRIWRRAGTVNANILKIAVMARGTITADTRVRKNRGGECSNRVANVTVLGRW